MVCVKLLVVCIVVISVLELALPAAALYTLQHGFSTYQHGTSYHPHGAGYGYLAGNKKSKFVPAGSISHTDYLLKKLKKYGAAVLNHKQNQAKALHRASTALGKQHAVQSLLHLTSALGQHVAGLPDYGIAGHAAGLPGYGVAGHAAGLPGYGAAGHAAGLLGYGATSLQNPYGSHQLAKGKYAPGLGSQYAVYSQYAARPYITDYAF